MGLPVPAGRAGGRGQAPPSALTGLLPQPQLPSLRLWVGWGWGWGRLQLALECESKHSSTDTSPMGQKTKLPRPRMLPAPHSEREGGRLQADPRGQPSRDTAVTGSSSCLFSGLCSVLSLSLLIFPAPL